MIGYIYKTTNKLNNKIYIGKRMHSTFDNSYYGSGRYFQKALNKYGKDNFSREVLEWCDTEDRLNEREIYWIKKFDAQNKTIGYNIASGGQGGNGGGFRNHKHSNSVKLKISQSISKYNQRLALVRQWLKLLVHHM